MKLGIFQSIVLVCALGLGACANQMPEHLALKAAARENIASTEIVAPVIQNEIYVFIPPSRAGAVAGGGFGAIGGLVGAIIDTSVDAANAKSATTSVKPLRDAMVDYSFDAKLKEDLQKSLSDVPWLKVDGVRILKDPRAETVDGAITNSTKGAVFIVAGNYHLNADATELTVAIKAGLYGHDAKLKPFIAADTANEKSVSHPGNAIYRNRVEKIIPLPRTVVAGAPVPSRDDNMKLWAADNGKLARASLDAALVDMCAQLAEDIQRETEPTPPSAGSKAR